MISKLTFYLTGEGHHETLHRFGERLGAFKILRIETHHWSAIISCLRPLLPCKYFCKHDTHLPQICSEMHDPSWAEEWEVQLLCDWKIKRKKYSKNRV